MKKNKSKQLMLTAMLMLSTGAILPFGERHLVNAAQQEEMEIENETSKEEKEIVEGSSNSEGEKETEGEETEGEETEGEETEGEEAEGEETEGEETEGEESGGEEEKGESKEESEGRGETGESKEEPEEEGEKGESQVESEKEEEKGESKKESEGEEEKGESKKESEGEEEKGESKGESEEEEKGESKEESEGERKQGESKEEIEEETGKEESQDEQDIEEEKNGEGKENTEIEEVGEEQKNQEDVNKENMEHTSKETEENKNSQQGTEAENVQEETELSQKNEQEEKLEDEEKKWNIEFIENCFEESEAEIKKKLEAIPGILETVKVQQIVLSPEIENTPWKEPVQSEEIKEKVKTNPTQEVAALPSFDSLSEETKPILDLSQRDFLLKETPLFNTEKPEILQTVPAFSVEKMEAIEENNGFRLHYFVDPQNLMEHQIKVFYNSGEQEEVIFTENQCTEGELILDKDGDYLVYFYTKDHLGNEKRVYENYKVGTTEIQLEKLNQFEHKKIEKEEMEEQIEEVLKGTNIASYQLYFNGEQYKGKVSDIPEGKCIMTLELEDTYGNSSEKNIEIVVTNSSKEEISHEKKSAATEGTKAEQKNQNENETMLDLENEAATMEESPKAVMENNKKDSSQPTTVVGILGSLISGLCILFRRMKH